MAGWLLFSTILFFSYSDVPWKTSWRLEYLKETSQIVDVKIWAHVEICVGIFQDKKQAWY